MAKFYDVSLEKIKRTREFLFRYGLIRPRYTVKLTYALQNTKPGLFGLFTIHWGVRPETQEYFRRKGVIYRVLNKLDRTPLGVLYRRDVAIVEEANMGYSMLGSPSCRHVLEDRGIPHLIWYQYNSQEWSFRFYSKADLALATLCLAKSPHYKDLYQPYE